MRAAVAEHRAVKLVGILHIDKVDVVDGLMCFSAGIVARRRLGVNRAEPLRLIIATDGCPVNAALLIFCRGSLGDLSSGVCVAFFTCREYVRTLRARLRFGGSIAAVRPRSGRARSAGTSESSGRETGRRSPRKSNCPKVSSSDSYHHLYIICISAGFRDHRLYITTA